MSKHIEMWFLQETKKVENVKKNLRESSRRLPNRGVRELIQITYYRHLPTSSKEESRMPDACPIKGKLIMSKLIMGEKKKMELTEEGKIVFRQAEAVARYLKKRPPYIV